MQIQHITDPTNADWLEMRSLLWPHVDAAEHKTDLRNTIANPQRLIAFMAVASDGCSAGFAEVALRHDYVNGCSTSPVVFLEGIYVRTEFASDALLDNTVSHAMHRRLGFKETDRMVYFKKML